MSDNLTRHDLALELGRHTRSIEQDNWQVGAGATTTVIPVALANPSGVGVGLTVGVQQRIQGTVCEFISGQNQGQSAAVANCAANGTLTLDAALPFAPASGDRFILLRSVNVSVDAPENVAQVGGQSVPTFEGASYLPIGQPPYMAGSVLNEAVAASTNVFTNSLQPAVEGRFQLRVLVSAASTFSVIANGSETGTTGAAETVSGALNDGTALTAGVWYAFELPVGPLETYNFQVGAACNLSLRVQYKAS